MSQQTADTEELDVSWYPNSTDELHELLTFYRRQTVVFKNDRSELEQILKSLKMSNAQKHELEFKLHQRTESNEELKKQLSDTHILLYNEKNTNIEFEAKIKSLSAQMNELENEKLHLLELVQSTNDILDEDKMRKHKNCKACTYKHSNRHNHKANNPQRMTTIYLPNENAETLKTMLRAKEEQLDKIKNESLRISEYLMNDRNNAYEALQELRTENNAKFEKLQNELTELSKEHLFNIKEYLVYRRNTNEKMHNLELDYYKIKEENNKIKQKYQEKVEKIETNKNAKERAMKKESKKMVNGFRMESMRKHKELKNVRDELETLSKSYHFDVNHLKNKLVATKKKNKKLSQRNKCQKEGISSDVECLKKRVNKLQKTMNSLALSGDDCNQVSLKREINQVQNALMQLAKVSKAEP